MPTADPTLPRALVALPGWRWAEGMRSDTGWRVSWEDAAGHGVVQGHLPDLAYPAPGRCVHAMLCATVRYTDAFKNSDPTGVWFEVYYGEEVTPQGYESGPTLGEACASALVAIGRVGPRGGD